MNKANEQLHEIPVSKIIPDPNQPRKTSSKKDKERLEKIVLELAAQIKTEGLINAIEVSRLTDDTYMIVTGEMRWTAVCYLIERDEFKDTITAKIIDIESEGLTRFRRQLIENSERGSMTVWEMATAFAKLLNLTKERIKEMGMAKIRQEYSWEIDKLSQQTGKGRQWILECIGYLQEPDDIQTYLQSDKGRAAVVRGFGVIRKRESIKVEHIQIIKEKMFSHDITDRDIMLRLGNELVAHPEKAELLLAQSYKSGRTRNMKKIDEIIERRIVSKFETEQEQADRNARDVSDQIDKFRLALEHFPVRNVSRIRLETLFKHVALFKGDIDVLYNALKIILEQKQLAGHAGKEVITYERT